MKPNPYLLKSTVVAALGGLLFGFDTAVISGTTSNLTEVYQLTPDLLGITVSAALIGTILGAMFAAIPGDKYGRRDSLRVMAVLYIISALGCAFAWNWSALVFFRFVGGLGIGGSSVLGPMYIAEIAPANWRGRLVGFFQFNIVSGILLAYLSNFLVGTQQLSVDAEWRWKLGIAAFPATLFCSLLFTIPRSPRWLVKKGCLEEAHDVLRRIRGQGDERSLARLGFGSLALLVRYLFDFAWLEMGLEAWKIAYEIRHKPNEPGHTQNERRSAARADQELQDIIESIDAEHGHADEPLFSRKYSLPIFLAITIGMFNQLSGINAILYYLNDIFAFAGFSKMSGDLQAVTVGVTNLIFTMIAMSVIDKVGRKKLLLIGSVGTAACLAGVAAIFSVNQHHELLVWLLVGFIASFAFSQGSVIWVYISEVFPNRVRAKGQSLGSFSHWVMNAAISFAFPTLAAWSKSIPFMFFSAMMVLQFFVVLFVYPETKGVTLEEMQKKLHVA